MFLINDVINSTGDPYEYVYWPPLVLMTAPFVSLFFVKVFLWYKRSGHATILKRTSVEMMTMLTTFSAKNQVDDASNPMHELSSSTGSEEKHTEDTANALDQSTNAFGQSTSALDQSSAGGKELPNDIENMVDYQDGVALPRYPS